MYLHWEFIGIVAFSQTKRVSPCGLAVRENITVRPIVKKNKTCLGARAS